MKAVLTGLMLVCLSGSTPAFAQDADLSAVIQKQNDAFGAACGKNDLDTMATMFSDDAIWRPDPDTTLADKAAIRDALGQGCGAPFELKAAGAELLAADLALSSGMSTLHMPADSGGDIQARYVAVYKKSGDAWKIFRLFDFPDFSEEME